MTSAAAEPTRPTSREDDPTSTGYIVALAGAPLSVAGSKSAHLGELLAAGFPVPDGFVVTTAAFSSHLARAGLGDAASTDALIAADVPTDVESAIRAQYARLGDVPVAVRSSSLSEDLAGASFAGQYETTLDVRGADAVVAAVRKCWASAFDARVTAYRRAIDGAAPPSMAVLVQRMVPAESAGVAFSADPVTGDRDLVVVSAVRGLGERLVSGQSFDDEWAVKGDSAERRRRREDAIDATVAKRVAELARRVQSHMGAPQDIEWACVGGEIHLLQARPITALPEQVRWEAPGCWLRNFRLGEWIGAPVTPSFETWLLDRIEQRMHGLFTQWTGFSMTGPAHVVLNGWYFYGMNYFPKTALGNLKMMLSMVVVLALRFRRIAGLFPPLAHLGVDWWVREWREQTLPEYRKAVSDAASRVEHAEPRQLVEMIDDLATHAGTYFTSMVAIAGYAAKAEMPLAKHWHAHLSSIDVSYLELVRGTTSQSASPAPHAIEGLDWVLPTAGERERADHAPDHAPIRARIAAERESAMSKVREALASKPRALRKIEALVTEARRANVLREEQSADLSLAWPVLRRAMLRLGDHLAAQGAIAAREDVFFLTRPEIEAVVNGATSRHAATIAERKQTWRRQRRLSPPLVIGELPGPLAEAFAEADRITRTARAAQSPGVRGTPASPGRVTGPARVVLGLDELDHLRDGEILVCPLTTPAWTPAFARAAAIVTDTGSIASHSSIVAREYGIPAVVGVGDATTRFRDGQSLTVDGSAGVVEVA